MENKDNIIELGSWNFPKSWDELDLKTFQEVEKYYSDKDRKFDLRDVLGIFTNHTEDEINALPIQFSEEIIGQLSWLSEEPKYADPTNSIEIDGERYVVNVQEKLKTGEYVAADTVLKGDKHNYAALMAILCRKEGEIYDSKFENEVLGERIAMWERQPMIKIMPIITFFLTLWLTSEQVTQLSSKVEEALSLTRKHIETLHKNGEVSKHSMKSAMKKLRKLEKSINYT